MDSFKAAVYVIEGLVPVQAEKTQAPSAGASGTLRAESLAADDCPLAILNVRCLKLVSNDGICGAPGFYPLNCHFTAKGASRSVLAGGGGSALHDGSLLSQQEKGWGKHH